MWWEITPAEPLLVAAAADAVAAPPPPASTTLDRRELPNEIGSHGELTCARVDRFETCDIEESSLHLLAVAAPPPSEDLMLP